MAMQDVAYTQSRKLRWLVAVALVALPIAGWGQTRGVQRRDADSQAATALATANPCRVDLKSADCLDRRLNDFDRRVSQIDVRLERFEQRFAGLPRSSPPERGGKADASDRASLQSLADEINDLRNDLNAVIARIEQ